MVILFCQFNFLNPFSFKLYVMICFESHRLSWSLKMLNSRISATIHDFFFLISFHLIASISATIQWLDSLVVGTWLVINEVFGLSLGKLLDSSSGSPTFWFPFTCFLPMAAIVGLWIEPPTYCRLSVHPSYWSLAVFGWLFFLGINKDLITIHLAVLISKWHCYRSF